jgi:hypothetical protein
MNIYQSLRICVFLLNVFNALHHAEILTGTVFLHCE